MILGKFFGFDKNFDLSWGENNISCNVEPPSPLSSFPAAMLMLMLISIQTQVKICGKSFSTVSWKFWTFVRQKQPPEMYYKKSCS